jgi:chromate transport protein ChrA
MHGMGAAVVGLIAVMSARIMRAGLRGRLAMLLAAATAIGVGPLALPTVWVIAGASALGLWLHRPRASEGLTPRGGA